MFSYDLIKGLFIALYKIPCDNQAVSVMKNAEYRLVPVPGEEEESRIALGVFLHRKVPILLLQAPGCQEEADKLVNLLFYYLICNGACNVRHLSLPQAVECSENVSAYAAVRRFTGSALFCIIP